MNNLTDYIEDLRIFEFAETIGKEFPYDWLIEESHGTYKGHIELARYLAADVEDAVNKNEDDFINSYKQYKENKAEKDIVLTVKKSEIKNIENIFFNKLSIRILPGTTNYNSHGKFDVKTKMFDSIELVIGFSDIFTITTKNFYKREDLFKHLFIIFAHEIMHAWGDYKTYISGKSKHLFDYYKEGAGIAANAQNFKKNHVYMSKEEMLCYNAIYTLIKTEQNSFISEINLLKDELENVTSYKDALKIYNNSAIYHKYSNIINQLQTAKAKQTYNRDIFETTYKEIYNKSISFDKAVNLLIVKLEKANKRMKKYAAMLYTEIVDKKTMNEIIKQDKEIEAALEARNLTGGMYIPESHVPFVNYYKNFDEILAGEYNESEHKPLNGLTL